MNLRYAFRLLLRSPGFTAVAVLTLALGIGINTIVFTLYSAVALKPIAASAPEQLVRIRGTQDGNGLDPFTGVQYEAIRAHAQSFSDLIATSNSLPIIAALPQSRQDEALTGRLVSLNYFSALGVTPSLGRPFSSDDRFAAVISHDFWTKRLQADPNVLSKSILVHGVALNIIGVAPPKFAGTGLPPRMPDLWIPLEVQTQVLPGADWLHDETVRPIQVLARRRARTTVQQASAELEVIASSWPLVNGKPAHLEAVPATFFQADSGEFSTFVVVAQILMIAVGLILLIGSVNLVNLLFARHAARDREFAVRLALGASRSQLIRQLCTESAVLGLAGGVFGLVLSFWTCEWIRVGIDSALRRIFCGLLGVFLDVTPDWHVFAYSAAVSLITGLAIGLWPALKASRRDVVTSLKQAGGASAPAHRKRSILIAAQVAACLMLLAGAGLLFRGVWRSATIDPGFDVSHVLLISADARTLAPSPAARDALLRKAVDRIRAVPELETVSWADRAPFLGHGSYSVRDEHGQWNQVLFNSVSDRYFDTLGMPVIAGRAFTAQEAEDGAPVLIVSDLAARRLWPGRNPLGQTVKTDPQMHRFFPRPSYTVIGVVKSVRSTYLSKPDEAFLYYPRPPAGPFTTLLVRSRVPQTAPHAILGALTAIDSRLPALTTVVALDQAPMELQRMMAEAPAAVAFVLGSLALFLASVGIFGLVTHLVTERTREIAIRVSLGAQIRDVVRTVLGQTMRPVMIGAVLGLAGAIAVSVLLSRLIVMADAPDLTYGAGAFDPITFMGSLAVLTLAVLAASILPVRRATRIAPAEALRAE